MRRKPTRPDDHGTYHAGIPDLASYAAGRYVRGLSWSRICNELAERGLAECTPDQLLYDVIYSAASQWARLIREARHIIEAAQYMESIADVNRYRANAYLDLEAMEAALASVVDPESRIKCLLAINKVRSDLARSAQKFLDYARTPDGERAGANPLPMQITLTARSDD